MVVLHASRRQDLSQGNRLCAEAKSRHMYRRVAHLRFSSDLGSIIFPADWNLGGHLSMIRPGPSHNAVAAQ